jgi:quercetin dioxygenase-like cupin family protein
MKRRTFFTLASMPLLNIPLQERSEKPFVVEAGKSRFDENLGGGTRNDLKISGKDTDGHWAMFEIHSKGKTGPALHIHQDQDETVFILEGEYLYQIGEEKKRFKTGDTIFIPRGTPHAFVHLNESTGRKLSMYQPANNIEEMFRQIGLLKEFSAEKIQAAMAVNNSKIVGKPLSAE